ncbi:hypothetical protein [Paenibacillus melissococcoides]|uniref:hypothetical protein n=1 Tax=Paenibacillus melissococcoides TaxID=2912268 RepID=UPI0038B41018
MDLLVSGCEARPSPNGLEKLKVAIPVSPDPGRHRRLQLVTQAIKQLSSPRRRRLQVGTAEDLRPGRPDEALAPPAAEQPPSCSNLVPERRAGSVGAPRAEQLPALVDRKKWISWYPDAKLGRRRTGWRN